MNAGGNKSKNTYEEVQQRYLEAGRKYSSLLRDAMELDPNIIKIAEEILITGDKISIHDNKLLTRFYNELRMGSKIDKKYYELLVNLKKAKNDLDIATDHLLAKRVGKILTEAGIPPRETNLSDITKVSHINNPDLNLAEKICLPGVLSIESATQLEQLIANGKLKVSAGKFTAETKEAREFIKKLEKEIRENVNDAYMLGSSTKIFENSGFGKTNSVIELVKLVADSDHIREIERRIDTDDIRFASGELVAINDKGTKYLKLLSEELINNLSKKIDVGLVSKNKNYINQDIRLSKSKKAVDTLCETVNKYDHFSNFVDKTVYNELLERLKEHQGTVEEKMSHLMAEIETISRAFFDIKKRLISFTSKDETNVEGLLSLLVASRYLSKFEVSYEKDLTDLERLLDIKTANIDLSFGPMSPDQLAENYCGSTCNHFDEANDFVRDIISKRMANRKSLGEKMEKVLTDFVSSPSDVEAYKNILCAKQAILKHISDVNYHDGSLYQGIGSLSHLIEDLVELEIEKREKIADFIHEFELTHKELWLAGIKNENKNFITDNFPDLDKGIKGKAAESNDQLVSSALEDTKKVIEKFRNDHKISSETFSKQLKESLEKLKTDGDLAGASTKLKNEYKKMLATHEQALNELEIEIGVIERRLTEFEKGSKKDLEKVLLDNIRRNI
jgi:polyhydroxyalkanoate synthesis regulator phasin